MIFNHTWRRDNSDIEQAKTGGGQSEQDELKLVGYQIEEEKKLELRSLCSASAGANREGPHCAQRQRVELGGGSRSHLSPWSRILGLNLGGSRLAARLHNRHQCMGWQEWRV